MQKEREAAPGAQSEPHPLFRHKILLWAHSHQWPERGSHQPRKALSGLRLESVFICGFCFAKDAARRKLTKIGQWKSMQDLRAISTPLFALCAGLAVFGCAQDTAPAQAEQTRDPIIARALHDPIMVDLDLVYRNEAAAALTTGAGQPLPVLAGNAELARLARDEARLELLEIGEIIELPEAAEVDQAPEISPTASAAETVTALGGPSDCSDELQADFRWAARLDRTIKIMPRGYVRAAAGVENDKCSVRVVRYLTPTLADAALEYHFNLFEGAELDASLFDAPQKTLVTNTDDGGQAVIVREAANAMRQVDLVYWRTK